MAKVKGIDLLIKGIASIKCPSTFDLTDVNRKENDGLACEYGNGKHLSTCIECFKQAIDLEYESEEE